MHKDMPNPFLNPYLEIFFERRNILEKKFFLVSFTPTFHRENKPYKVAIFKCVTELFQAKNFFQAFNQKSVLCPSLDWYKVSVNAFTDGFDKIEA